uniref:Octopamine receptor 1-like n=1 Tax=Saccoglossus kowalevskii TaxID=10224 RepID=A0ABM0M9E2_SACKO|nr:PREDICTED: octopamine receptor 1-like [Saccoglossus kowalevskii]
MENTTTAGDGNFMDTHQEEFAWSVVQSVITFFVILNNTVVILAFAVFPTIRNSQSNLYILNMSVTDLLLGVLGLPLAIHYSRSETWIFGYVSCSFYESVLIVFSHESIFSAMMLCLDKYIFIKYPLHYYSIVTRRRILFSLAITWLASLVFGVFPTFTRLNEEYRLRGERTYPLCFSVTVEYVIVGMCLNFIPLNIIIYVNYFIFKTLRKQLRCRVRPSVANDQNSASEEITRNERQLKPGEIKVIKTMILIVIVLLCLWIPFFVSLLTNSICFCLPPEVVEFAMWLGFSNSAINPVLYAFKKDIRSAFSRICHCRFHMLSVRDNELSITATDGRRVNVNTVTHA